MYTKRVLFCTDPDVNFDFFYIPPSLGYLRPPLSLTGFPWKIPYFNGQKVGISNKRGNRVTESATGF